MSDNVTSPPPKREEPVARPRLLDYLLILAGCALSLLLAELSGLRAVKEGVGQVGLEPLLLRLYPQFLMLPVGILLLWPVFYCLQALLGRKQPLTVAEWLWVIAWLGALLLTTCVLWRGLGSPPEFMTTPDFQHALVIGFVIAALSLGGVSLVVLLIDMFNRSARPWTHACAFVLLIWPALPLAALWLGQVQLE